MWHSFWCPFPVDRWCEVNSPEDRDNKKVVREILTKLINFQLSQRWKTLYHFKGVPVLLIVMVHVETTGTKHHYIAFSSHLGTFRISANGTFDYLARSVVPQDEIDLMHMSNMPGSKPKYVRLGLVRSLSIGMLMNRFQNNSLFSLLACSRL